MWEIFQFWVCLFGNERRHADISRLILMRSSLFRCEMTPDEGAVTVTSNCSQKHAYIRSYVRFHRWTVFLLTLLKEVSLSSRRDFMLNLKRQWDHLWREHSVRATKRIRKELSRTKIRPRIGEKQKSYRSYKFQLRSAAEWQPLSNPRKLSQLRISSIKICYGDTGCRKGDFPGQLQMWTIWTLGKSNFQIQSLMLKHWNNRPIPKLIAQRNVFRKKLAIILHKLSKW